MVSWLTVGCNDDTIQKRDITIEAFSELKAPVFEISPEKVFSQIGKLGKVGKDTLSPSSQTAWHYQRTGQLLWVNRQGVTPMADTLLQRLIHVDEIGFASTGFKVQEIERMRPSFRVAKLKDASDALLRNIKVCLMDEAFVHQLHEKWGFGIDRLL
jgi:hypothetical protein